MGLVHLEMEGTGNPAAAEAGFPHPDFAAFARVYGVEASPRGRGVSWPGAVRAWLAAPGPAILHAIVHPDEVQTMPPIGIGRVARFGIAKIKETAPALAGR